MGRVKIYTKKACRDCSRQYRAAKKKYAQHRNIIQKLFGYCPCCERYFRFGVKTQRRATAYVNEDLNWLTACRVCHEDDDEYYADLWEQYYGSI